MGNLTAVCYSYDLADRNAMGYLRLIAPLEKAGISIVNGLEEHNPQVDKISQCNLVIIQRNFPQAFQEYSQIIALARKEGKPVILDMDDLLLSLPDDHPDRQTGIFTPALMPIYQALIEADLVTVPTPALKAVLSHFNNNIAVLPNFLDDTLWHLRPPVLKRSGGEPLTLGFMGTYSHIPDLQILEPVLYELLKRYPERLQFRCFGIEPPARLKALPQVKSLPKMTVPYTKFAEFFQQQSVDIFIAPLADNLFNRCKSFLKFFEYSALGAAGIYSRVTPYESIIVDGENGFLAGTLDEWRDHLIRLIEDDELRYHLALNAQTTIREKWLLSRNANRWSEEYQKILQKPLRPEPGSAQVVQSINLQIQAAFADRERRIHDLYNQIAQREETIRWWQGQAADLSNGKAKAEKEAADLANGKAQAEKEAVGYALSTSWKITRPLRKISKLLGRKK